MSRPSRTCCARTASPPPTPSPTWSGDTRLSSLSEAARQRERPVLGLYFDELSVGQSAETTHVVGAADLEAFAAVSGDFNPVHMDDAYARTTTFGGRIPPGMPAAAYITAGPRQHPPGPGRILLFPSPPLRR